MQNRFTVLAVCALLLLAISLVFGQTVQHEFINYDDKVHATDLLVGWLWYVGMLVPVIGLVQVGNQSRADRYTYLTQIGLYIAVAWAVLEVFRRWPYRRWVCGVTAAVALLILALCARQQTSYWHDSEALWTHAVACTSRNGLAHVNLAQALARRGEIDAAIEQFHKALEINMINL